MAYPNKEPHMFSSKAKTQARRVADVALNMADKMTNGEVLSSLNQAYQAGYEQAAEDLARGILSDPAPRGLKLQAL